MSMALVVEALKIRGLTKNEKAVLLVLADHYNTRTGLCNPRRERIAWEAEISLRSLSEVLPSLEAKGLIRRISGRRRDGSQATNFYDVLPGKDALLSGGRTLSEDPFPQSPFDDPNDPIFPDFDDRDGGEGYAKSATPPMQPLHTPPMQPLHTLNGVNVNLNQEDVTKLTITPAKSAFDAFWSAYPRKVGKPLAKKSFDRAVQSGSPPAAIIAAAEAYAERWRQTATDPAFIPHPSTWLNQERFNDDPHAAIPDARPTRPANSPFDEMARGFARAAGSDEPKPDPVDIF